MLVLFDCVKVEVKIMTDKECTCPKVDCERHGNCDACEENHTSKGALPFCKREEGDKN